MDLPVDPQRHWIARDHRTVAWPAGARAAISVTFDVDADLSGAHPTREPLDLLDGVPTVGRNLTRVSEGQFGIRRGLGRILDLLDEHDVRGTFFVPGVTALRYPDQVAEIAARGHEIGHHGYLHLSDLDIGEAERRHEMEAGLEALARVLDTTPVGYRSPSWELSATTLELLREFGFVYDSSMMSDDRPYEVIHEASGFSLVELPSHWDLDDWPYFPIGSARPMDRDVVLDLWWEALSAARLEGRHVVYTFHPEVVGRAHRLPVLGRLLAAARATSDLWIAPLGEIHRHVRARWPTSQPDTAQPTSGY